MDNNELLTGDIKKNLLKVSLPTMSGFVLQAVYDMVDMIWIGRISVAAAGIGTRLFSFAFTPIMGIVMGASTIIGQNLGANNIDRAKETAKFSALINIGLMAGLAIISQLFPKQIMSIFINDPNVIETGIPMIRLLIPSLILAGWSLGLGAVFTGSGHNTPYLLASIISRWFVQIPILYITTKLLSLPVIYVWLSFFAAELAELIVIIIHYKKGKWITKRV